MIRFLSVLLLIAFGTGAGAVELVEPLKVAVSETTATLSWRTDVACGTRLSYGIAADKLDQKSAGGVSSEHVVTLEGLQKDTTYFYSAGSAREKLSSGSFKTGSARTRAPVAVVPVVKPVTTAALTAPPARATWGNPASLEDHFERHGADFQCVSAEDYAAQAWRFLQRAKAGGLPMKWDDADNTLRVFDPATRAFAAYNNRGRTKTYFRPQNPGYWQRQPGRPVQPSQLPFQ